MTTLALSLKTKSFDKFNLFSDIKAIAQKLMAEIAISRTIAELQALSDRQLNDLGMERADIAQRVRNTLHG